MKQHMQSHRWIFLADKHTEVEIPGAVGHPTVRRNAFTENTIILYAINILSREEISISRAQKEFGQMGHRILFTLWNSPHKHLVQTLKLEQASSMVFAGSIKEVVKIWI